MVQLSPDEINKRDFLLNKFNVGPLTRQEAEELKRILEKEKQRAIELGDIALIFGIALLLKAIMDFLSEKKNPLKRLFS